MIFSVPLLDILLIGGRMGGMIFASPIFGSRNYPVQMKIGLTMFTSILIFPLIGIGPGYDLSTFWDFGLYLTNEIVIGIFIGLILTMYFNFIYVAGSIIDRDIGFAMVNVVSPMDESEMPITSNIFYVMSTLIFLILDLHHQLITALVISFSDIPLGTGFFSVDSFPILLEVLKHSFVLGFRIAAPFVIVILIANMILGMLAKAMPGMNVFILGMPFKILFGLLLLIVLMPYMYQFFADLLKYVFYYVEWFFSLFNS